MDEIEAHKRTDAKLQTAKEVAEAANHAKSRYVVGLSHELRTPLNAIFGYAQLLERDASFRRDNRAIQVRGPPQRRAPLRPDRRTARHLQDRGRPASSQPQRGAHSANSSTRSSDMFRLQATAKGIDFDFKRPCGAACRRLYRREAAAADSDQSAVERHQVHRSRQRAVRRELPQPGGRIRDRGYRHRHPGRAISNGSSQPFERGALGRVAAADRHRARPDHHQAADRRDGRRDHGRPARSAKAAFSGVKLLLSEVAVRAIAPVEAPIFGYHGPRKTILVSTTTTHRDLVREVLAPLGFIVLSAPDGPDASRWRNTGPTCFCSISRCPTWTAGRWRKRCV